MAVGKLQEYIDSVDELQKAYSKVREYDATIGDVGRYQLKGQRPKKTVI